jgi:hypothetical protein
LKLRERTAEHTADSPLQVVLSGSRGWYIAAIEKTKLAE